MSSTRQIGNNFLYSSFTNEIASQVLVHFILKTMKLHVVILASLFLSCFGKPLVQNIGTVENQENIALGKA